MARDETPYPLTRSCFIIFMGPSCFISCFRTMHPTHGNSHVHLCSAIGTSNSTNLLLTALHRRIIWSSFQLSIRRRPSLRSSSVSDRDHTPLSEAFSQVCKLGNVSHSCNHQHSLSAREAFFIMLSLTRMYFELCLGCSHRHSLSTSEVFFTRPVW